ncbi:CCA tRNA nucleotidyltransferase [Tistrella bauzanensis]
MPSSEPVLPARTDPVATGLVLPPAMTAAPVRRVLAALAAAGGEARFVGGAVRDLMAGQPSADIDLATTLLPDAVMAAASQAGIKAVPTGIDHGTVTLVADRVPVEVTTLRRDVATDGRRAVVAFTQDWSEDARRRDFTVNAMSLSADGRLYDPFDGLADLANGRVRFIGDARRRILEDVLRILRFFRFEARIGRGAPDRTALDACRELAERIDSLSGSGSAMNSCASCAAPPDRRRWYDPADGRSGGAGSRAGRGGRHRPLRRACRHRDRTGHPRS